MIAKDIMTKGVDWVAPDCSVLRAARLMKTRNVGILPVCGDEGVEGVLTDRDIVVRAAAEGADLARLKVRRIMTKDPAYCHEEDDLAEVAKLMEEKHLRRILVANRRDKMVGVLTLGDLTRRGIGQELVGEILESAAARHVDGVRHRSIS